METFCHLACKRYPPKPEDVLEWLQPSGRRPEGCCCSTELSGGRGRELGVAGYYTRPIMHAPHTLRLTLANIQRRTACRHQSFDHAQQNAVRRCSTSASMYSSRAMQREQSSSSTEKAATAPHRVRTAVLWQHSGHSGVMQAATIGQSCQPVACFRRPQCWG